MDNWAIDSSGLRGVGNRLVLDRLRNSHRLHVSPLTWEPASQTSNRTGELTLISTEIRRTRNATAALDSRLRDLHERGILIVDDDHECDPQHVADVETSWQQAGLAWRPTNETLSAVITADRLGMDLITEDSDAHRLATHWQVHPISVAQFASALAA
jgi:hypothetical protein